MGFTTTTTTLLGGMMEILHMSYYNVSFFGTSFEITTRLSGQSTRIYNFLQKLIIFIFIPLVFSTVGCIAAFSNDFYSVIITIIGVVVLFVGICLVVIDTKNEKMRNKEFRLIVNDIGVTHIDLKRKFHIPWSEVNSFGIVNQVHMLDSFGILGKLRANRRYGSQTVLYFSNQRYIDKKLLRRTLMPKLNQKWYRSTPRMIVFEFQEDNIEELIREKLNPYIYKYCDTQKEFSCIETAPWV